jgi:hypothetical protein
MPVTLRGARFSGRQSRRFKLRAFANWEPACPSLVDTPVYNGYAAQNHGDHVKPSVRQSMVERPQPGPRPHYSEGTQSQPPPREERQRWSDAPHEQFVGAFRGLIQQERQRYGDLAHRFSPAYIVRKELKQQENFRLSIKPEHKQRAEFFKTIRQAWDAIAYEHYQWQPGHLSEYQINARWDLSIEHWNAKDRQDPNPELIRLDPMQVKILDALAEAADIPHQRGQSEVAIPEHLRDYAEESIKQDEERRRAEDERRRGK